MEKLKFRYDCVNPENKEELFHIVDNNQEITFDTFKKRINLEDFKSLCRNLVYAVGKENGLHIKDDWHVSYHKARYHGKPIYFLKHSAIEYVFK